MAVEVAPTVQAPTAHADDWRLLGDGLVAGLHDTYALVESSGSESGVEVLPDPGRCQARGRHADAPP